MLDASLDLDAVTVEQPRQAYELDGKTVCEWAQDTATVTIYVTVGSSVKPRELDVNVAPKRLTVSRKGGGVLLAGPLGGECDSSECEWELVSGELRLVLRKNLQREWLLPLTPDEALTYYKGKDDKAAATPAKPAASKVAATPPKDGAARSSTSHGKGKAVAAASSGGAGGAGDGAALGKSYAAWDRFDEVEAIAACENEGKSADEPSFTLRSTPGEKGGSGSKSGAVAAMQCTDYVKDREEVSLDLELAEKREELAHTINERLAEAAQCKKMGNELLGKGENKEALEAYLTGEAHLESFETHARPMLTSRLVGSIDRLLIDLRSNAAAAALKIEEWEVAIEVASSVIDKEPNHVKALYRRAKAREANGARAGARIDLHALLKADPRNVAGRKFLADLDALDKDRPASEVIPEIIPEVIPIPEEVEQPEVVV